MTKNNTAAIKVLLTISCVFFSTLQSSPAGDGYKKMANTSACSAAIMETSRAGKVIEENKFDLSGAVSATQAWVSHEFGSRKAGKTSSRPAAVAAIRG